MKDFFGFPLLPMNAAKHGEIIDQVTVYVHCLMLILFIGWMTYFIYALIKFRKGKHPKASYKSADGKANKLIEVGVILAEVVLLFGFSIPLWSSISNTFPNEKDSLVVRVIGEQFAWNFHYPGLDGKFGRTKPEMVDSQSNPLGIDSTDPWGKDDLVTKLWKMPVDKPVIAHVSSKDVIHSLGIPAMRIKVDATPGEKIPVTFTPVKTGKFLIACSQLCGIGHSTMRGFIEVVPQIEFDEWYAQQSKNAIEEASEDSW